MATFSPDELKILIDTAHLYVKVAARAINRDSIKTLLRLDIDSIEHGYCVYPDAVSTTIALI
jgi:imidazolonepropionase-like amidohydrolase